MPKNKNIGFDSSLIYKELKEKNKITSKIKDILVKHAKDLSKELIRR